MKQLKKIVHFKKSHRLLFFAGVFVVSFCFIFSSLLFFAQKYFADRVLPNTYFSHFTLSGKNRAEVEVIVDRAINVYSGDKISVSYEGVTKDFNLSDLGVALSTTETVDRIMHKSESEGFLHSIISIFESKKVAPVYYVNTLKLDESLLGSFGQFEKMPVDARVVFVGKDFVRTESSTGSVIDRNLFLNELKESLGVLSKVDTLLIILEAEPSVTTVQAESVLDDFRVLNGDQVTLSYGYDKWPLSGQQLYDLVGVGRSGQTESSLLNVNSGLDVGLSLNVVKMDELLDEMSQILNKQARDATLQFSGGKVTEFTSAQDGQALNRDETKKLFFAQILKLNSDKNIVGVKLPVSVVKAKIANAEINKLGIKELIGTGVSYYSGSIPNRMFNVELGAKFINGTLVAPDEVFSFVRLVGDVSSAQGFKPAYIIKSGRTVLDDGGGICQVSTTVFRAALNSGLPIVKRTAHAYRVSYYEQKGFKPGLDATIFSPSVDLQFRNDTGRHILVQTTVDRVIARMQVDIYGTSDGRRVELGEPIVSNIIPAPEPRYEDDPTLPTGTTKQVDFAVAGATSVFTRKVYKGNNLVIDESFRSVFRPWQAVYLVGKAS